jgi:hypothetical protein
MILTDNIMFSLFFNTIYYLCNDTASNKKITDINIDNFTIQLMKEPHILMNAYKRSDCDGHMLLAVTFSYMKRCISLQAISAHRSKICVLLHSNHNSAAGLISGFQMFNVSLVYTRYIPQEIEKYMQGTSIYKVYTFSIKKHKTDIYQVNTSGWYINFYFVCHVFTRYIPGI